MLYERDLRGRLECDLEWLIVYGEREHLRVLIANERKDRLALVAPTVMASATR
jgi:hypothetical protein